MSVCISHHFKLFNSCCTNLGFFFFTLGCCDKLHLLWLIGVLSEEQIRLKKLKKQQEEETARTSTVVTPTPPQEAAMLDPRQQEMIEKLVAMQKQCNKRSFLDRPKVTVSGEYMAEPIFLKSCFLFDLIFNLYMLTALATESRPAESRGATAAVCPLYRVGNNVGSGDCGFRKTASRFP